MENQNVYVTFSRDEILYLRGALAFLSDPKRCTQPLHDITSKVNAAFMRLDRKVRDFEVKDDSLPLVEFINRGGV